MVIVANPLLGEFQDQDIALIYRIFHEFNAIPLEPVTDGETVQCKCRTCGERFQLTDAAHCGL